MLLVTNGAINDYLRDDRVGRLVGSGHALHEATSQRWLDENQAKRFIFDQLYGDLLAQGSGRRVLDVGGGLTALSPRLADHNDYTLIDPLVHEAGGALEWVASPASGIGWRREDWLKSEGLKDFDVLVANDIFPNVDQRLALFIDWARPKCREIRLALTFYNTPRWYHTQRTDCEEQLYLLAFDGERTRAALSPVKEHVEGWTPELFDANTGSPYANGRQVVLATIRGEA